MSQAEQTTPVVYTTNGSTTEFAVPFTITQASDLLILYKATDDATESEITTGFSLNVDLDTVTFVTAPAAGKMAFLRQEEKSNDRSWTTGVPFTSSSVEGGLDKVARTVQELKEIVDRCLKLQSIDDLTGNLKLPVKASRASKVLAFDADGEPIAATGIDSALVSAFVETLLDDVDAAAFMATLGFTWDPSSKSFSFSGTAPLLSVIGVSSASLKLTTTNTDFRLQAIDSGTYLRIFDGSTSLSPIVVAKGCPASLASFAAAGRVDIGGALAIGSGGRVALSAGSYNGLSVNDVGHITFSGASAITLNGFADAVYGQIIFYEMLGGGGTFTIVHASGVGTQDFRLAGSANIVSTYGNGILTVNIGSALIMGGSL